MAGYGSFPVGSRVRCGPLFPTEGLRGLLGTVVGAGLAGPDLAGHAGWAERLVKTDVLVWLDEDPRWGADRSRGWSFIVPTEFLVLLPDPKYSVEEIVGMFVR